jgi:hypothetical protein
MPCWGCGYTKRVPYDPKREMKRRRTLRRRSRHAIYEKDQNVLSEKGERGSKGMG